MGLRVEGFLVLGVGCRVLGVVAERSRVWGSGFGVHARVKGCGIRV